MQRHSSHRRQRGLSLVELLVATVISLLGVLIIFQVFAVNEDVRRTTTSGSDEQTSGLMALMSLERELRHAGFGINDFAKTAPRSILGCKMRMYDAARTPSTVPDFPLAPVEILSNNGTTPDVIRVIYGGSKHTSTGVQVFEVKTPTDPVKLEYRFGFDPGDVVVIGEEGSPCTLLEVTNEADGSTDLDHGIGAYTFKSGNDTSSKVPRFNDPAGLPQIYTYPLAKVLNLGPFPVYAEMTVRNAEGNPRDNNQLVAQNLWGEMPSPQPVAEQIVHLKAEYGMDDGKDNGTVSRGVYLPDDNLVDNFTGVSPDPDKPEEWRRIRSVRLAIVSRSLTPDRPPCSATPAYSGALNDDTYPVRWARGPDAPMGRPIDVQTTADWQCYRYRVYETTVPLRNMLWRQQ
jgi:type IV pilus assembly protein PilW